MLIHIVLQCFQFDDNTYHWHWIQPDFLRKVDSFPIKRGNKWESNFEASGYQTRKKTLLTFTSRHRKPKKNFQLKTGTCLRIVSNRINYNKSGHVWELYQIASKALWPYFYNTYRSLRSIVSIKSLMSLWVLHA